MGDGKGRGGRDAVGAGELAEGVADGCRLGHGRPGGKLHVSAMPWRRTRAFYLSLLEDAWTA